MAIYCNGITFYFQKLNSEECELNWQKQFGILYDDDAFIIFQAQVIDVSTVVSLVAL